MPIERTRCIMPGAVTAEDLVAYGRGEAPPNVVEHVSGCQVCRKQGEEYARIERTLLERLYRSSCPATITIGEYAMGLLSSEETQRLAEHLAECRHCAEERRGLAAFLSEPDAPPQRTPGIASALRRLIAQPLLPTSAAAGLRGTDGEETSIYEADGIRLAIGVQKAADPAFRVVVALLEEGGESGAGIQARLYDGDTLLQTETMDDLGNVLFAHVAPGMYRIEMTFGDATVLIDPFRVP